MPSLPLSMKLDEASPVDEFTEVELVSCPDDTDPERPPVADAQWYPSDEGAIDWDA